MGRYNSDPTQVAAGGFQIYEAGEYLVEIGEPKGKEIKEGVAGINWPLKFIDGQYKDKMMFFFGNELNDIGKQQNKRLMLAAHGYKQDKEGEERFNQEFKGKDFDFDSDGFAGEGWVSAKGKAIRVKIDVTQGKTPDTSGNQYQQFKAFMTPE